MSAAAAMGSAIPSRRQKSCWLGTRCAVALPTLALVVLFVLGMIKVISSRWLYKRRPYWFLALAIVANFLTPGVDPLTPMIMFVPLYVFFEATALLLKLLGR